MSRYLTSLFASILTLCAVGYAQAPAAPTRSRAIGQVTAIDKAARHLTVHSDAGSDLKVTVDDGTSILKFAAGQRDARTAPHIPFGEINVGDRVIAIGNIGDDQKTIAARTIAVMSKDEVAKKQETDREAWNRGISGVVKAVDAEKKSVTVTVRGFGGGREVTVDAAKSAFRRYAPDSVKFADAKPGTLADIKAGDQMMARGTAGAENTQFTADEIVSGTFHHMAAKIKSVDAAANTLVVTDLDAKTSVTVHINADSTLRKVPEEMAERMAQFMQFAANRQAGGSGGPAGAPGGEGGFPRRRGGEGPGAAAGPGGPGAPGGPGGPGGQRGGGRGGIQRLLESSPAITLADLKPGDALVVASTIGAKADEVTAITLIAGVEPILRQPNHQVMLGNWNLGMNAPSGGF